MARYYDMDKLKALIEAKADTLVKGKETFLYVAKWLDLLPHEDVAPVHHAYWKVVTVIKEDCVFGSNRLMQYKVCSHCEQPMGVCGTDYCGHCGAIMDGFVLEGHSDPTGHDGTCGTDGYGHCGAIMDGFVLEGHSDPTGHDGTCGEPGMDAVTFAKREVAREIFEEIEEALQYEIDLEDKYGRNAWAQGDVSGFQTHEYTEDKLETILVSLSLFKKKYTEEKEL